MSLRSEISEQRAMLAHIADTWSDEVERIRNAIPRPEGVLLIGRGTSDNAARFAQYLWGIEHGIPGALAAPSLTTGYQSTPKLPDDWAVVAISQSGASPDLSAVLGAPRYQSLPRVAATNDSTSLLASAATVVVPLGAGSEVAVAATKTYVAELCAVLKLSDAWGAPSSGIDSCVEAVQTVFDDEEHIRDAAHSVATMGSCAVLGRGLHMATAFEWALKITETSAIGAVPFSSADFLHGPVAMIDGHTPLLAVIDDDPFTKELSEIVRDLSSTRNAPSVVVTTVDSVMADFVIRIPKTEQRLAPIVAAVAAQIFSLHLALARGLDPDSPRGLSKVTETL